MKKVYICSPYSGDTERNREYAAELTLKALKWGYAPITPHLYITTVLDDNDPVQRELGRSAALELLRACDMVFVGQRHGISPGMRAEICEAERLGIHITGDLWQC